MSDFPPSLLADCDSKLDKSLHLLQQNDCASLEALYWYHELVPRSPLLAGTCSCVIRTLFVPQNGALESLAVVINESGVPCSSQHACPNTIVDRYCIASYAQDCTSKQQLVHSNTAVTLLQLC